MSMHRSKSTEIIKQLNKTNVMENLKGEHNVRFSNVPTYKPPTYVNTEELIPTKVRNAEYINSLKTKEEIVEYSDRLLKELEKVEKMKQEKYDKMGIKEQYEQIEEAFNLLNKRKIEIQIKEKVEEIKYAKGGAEKQTEKPLHCQKSNEHIVKKFNEPIEKKHEKIMATETSFIYNYLKNLYTFHDIVVVFNCCVLGKNSIQNIIDHAKSLVEEHSNLRIAVYCCKSVGIYDVYDFIDHSSKFPLQAKSIQSDDIRNQLISVNWNKKALKIVCNVISKNCNHNKSGKINEDDPVQSFMNYNRIVNAICCYDKNQNKSGFVGKQYTIKSPEDVFDEVYFGRMIKHRVRDCMMIHLYDLKRLQKKSNDDILNEIKHKKSEKHETLHKTSEVTIYRLGDKNIRTETISFRDFLPFKTSKISSVEYEDVTSFYGINKVVLYDKQNEKDKKPKMHDVLWIEIFSNEETCLKTLEIHETARYWSEAFNKFFKKEYLTVSDFFLITSESNKMFGQRVYLNTQKPDLNSPMSYNILQTFLHFTYLQSNKKLVVIDLRVFTSQSKEQSYLLTEPIVLCTDENRYGPSNLGIQAINDLMTLHKCTQMCEQFTKEKNNIETNEYDCSIL